MRILATSIWLWLSLGMNFLALSYFKTVAEELNITHAAQKHYISQQALSSHIRNLENELGVRLFDRNPRLSLTDAGRCLYEAVQGIDAINSNLNAQLNDIRREEKGELRLGLTFTRGQFILPLVLPGYAVDHPHVHISIFEEHTGSLKERLIRGELDFWITADNPDIEGLSMDPLFEEHFLLVVPEKVLSGTVGEEAARKILSAAPEEFRMEDVIDCPFVLLNPGNRSRDKFDNALRSRKLTPNILLETDNSQTAFALAQKEMALTVYSDMFLRNYAGELNENVRMIPLEKYMPADVLHVYYREENAGIRYKRSFLDNLHAAFATRQTGTNNRFDGSCRKMVGR